MDLEFRPIRAEEADRYLRQIETAFTYVPTEDDIGRESGIMAQVWSLLTGLQERWNGANLRHDEMQGLGFGRAVAAARAE